MKKQGYIFSFQHLKISKRGFFCIFMLFSLIAFLLGIAVLQSSPVNAQTVPGEEWGQQSPTPDPETDGGSYDDNYSVVHIPDKNLEKAIREHLNMPSGDITKENMLWLIELVADGYETDGHAGPIKHSNGIKDLTGLEYAKNLESLSMNYNDIIDIAPLKGLSNLGSLYLDWNMIKNIETLSNLTSLKVLALSANGMSDISSLSSLTNLEGLFLGGNNIYDISPLSNLRNLKTLNIVNNDIYDISPIANLEKLEYFIASDNSIVNIEPLKNIKTFKSVSIGWNYIDINPGSTSKKIIDDLISAGVDVRYSPQRDSTPAPNADLSALTINDGDFFASPFSPNRTSYTFLVDYNINSVNITARLSDLSATMKINGVPVESGAARKVSLNAAGTSTRITVAVTARDGVTQKTYRVLVMRGSPPDKTDLADFRWSPSPASTNRDIEFYLSSPYIDSGDIDSLEWTFKMPNEQWQRPWPDELDAGTFERRSYEESPTVNYSRPGKYSVKLVVIDNTGTRYESSAVVVVGNDLSSYVNDYYQNTKTHLSSLEGLTSSIAIDGTYFIDELDASRKNFLLKIAHKAFTTYVGKLVDMDNIKKVFFDIITKLLTTPQHIGSKDSLYQLETVISDANNEYLLAFEALNNQGIASGGNISRQRAEIYGEDLRIRGDADKFRLTEIDNARKILSVARIYHLTHKPDCLSYALEIFLSLVAGKIGIVLSVDDLNQEYQAIKQSESLALMAIGAVLDSKATSNLIYDNYHKAIEMIVEEKAPVIPMVRITVVEDLNTMHSSIFSNTVLRASSKIRVSNLGSETTHYELFLDWIERDTFDTEVTVRLKAEVTLPPNTNGEIVFNHFQSNGGLLTGLPFGYLPPDNTPMKLTVLGTTDTGTYHITEKVWSYDPDETRLSANTSVEIFNNVILTSVRPIQNTLNTEHIDIVSPIISIVQNDFTSYSYHMQVLARNPFEVGVDAVIIQEIPASVDIINMGGATIDNNQLRWEIKLEPGEVVLLEAEFICNEAPGTQIDFNATNLLMLNSEYNLTYEIQGNPYGFIQRSPLQFDYHFPEEFKPGELTNITVNLENLLEENSITGNLVLEAKGDEEGVVLFTESITIEAGSNIEVVASFNLDLAPGSYSLKGYFDAGTDSLNLFNETIEVGIGHVIGKVHLQGLYDYSDVEVKLGDYTSTTKFDGSFSFLNIPIGDYKLEVNHAAYQNYSMEVNLDTGWQIVSDISLKLTNQPPVAFINFSNDKTRYSALSSYSPDDVIVSCNWDFGDGNTVEGVVVEHEFLESGLYDVELTVIDSRGLSDSKVVPIVIEDTRPDQGEDTDSEEEADPEEILLGDVTGNGKVDVEDVTLVMKYVLELEKLTDKQKKAADVNGDGVVNVIDVVLIMQYALDIIDEF